MNWPRAFRALLAQLDDRDEPLIIDPPRTVVDMLPAAATCISLDYAIWRHIPVAQRRAFTSELPESAPASLILFLPRAKERLKWWLHQFARCYPGRSLWIAGANVHGGRSIGRQVETALHVSARRVHALGHVTVWKTRLPDSPRVSGDAQRCYEHAGITVHALPGVFGYAGVDDGSALLLESIRQLRPTGRVLDFGCGTGIIAAQIGVLAPQAHLLLCDSDALALRSAERTLHANQLSGEVFPADGWHGVAGKFDWIVSNPPFHIAGEASLEIAYTLIRHASEYLARRGRLLLVANRHLPLEQDMQAHFTTLANPSTNTHFKVLSACHM